MILNKTNQSNRGFTIVELLVVIVVIGILASITIVSYTGITSRANTQANKQNASNVVSAIQAYYAENSSYPAANVAAINGGNNTAQLPSSVEITTARLTSGDENLDNVQYLTSGTDICIGYWDYTDSEDNDGVAGMFWFYLGTATNGTDGATPTCE